jgi:hypothetical protein
MGRLLLMALAGVPLAWWAVDELNPPPMPPPKVRPSPAEPPVPKEAKRLIADRKTLAALVALSAEKAGPDARPADLAGVAQVRSGKLWLAGRYAEAFEDPRNAIPPEEFAQEPVLKDALVEKRTFEVETAKARTELADLIRSWLTRSKTAGKPLPRNDKEKGFDSSGRTKYVKAEWSELKGVFEELDGGPPIKDQLVLLGRMLKLAPRLAPSGADDRSQKLASDLRALARGLYVPMLPETVKLDDRLYVQGEGDDPVEREKVEPDKWPGGVKGKVLDEFEVNSNPARWEGRTFKVKGKGTGLPGVYPTATSIIRRWYQVNRDRLLPREGDWRLADLRELHKECLHPTAMKDQKKYAWLKQRKQSAKVHKELEILERDAKVLAELEKVGVRLAELLDAAEKAPELFGP